VLFVLFSAADAGALPNVVEKEQLTSAVAAQQASSSATAMVAPAAGGALFQLFRGLPFLVDAVSYAASALALSAVRLEFQHAQKRDRNGLRSEIASGLPGYGHTASSAPLRSRQPDSSWPWPAGSWW
jgi:hypothetical protein